MAFPLAWDNRSIILPVPKSFFLVWLMGMKWRLFSLTICIRTDLLCAGNGSIRRCFWGEGVAVNGENNGLKNQYLCRCRGDKSILSPFREKPVTGLPEISGSTPEIHSPGFTRGENVFRRKCYLQVPVSSYVGSPGRAGRPSPYFHLTRKHKPHR